jgi:hypothetical protein
MDPWGLLFHASESAHSSLLIVVITFLQSPMTEVTSQGMPQTELIIFLLPHASIASFSQCSISMMSQCFLPETKRLSQYFCPGHIVLLILIIDLEFVS